MISDEWILNQREIKGLHFSSTPIMACSSNDFFLFLNSDGVISTFDSDINSLQSVTLPQTKIKGTVIGIALSPNHVFASVGYDNGIVSFFDLKENKLIKTVQEDKGVPIIYSAFVSETTFLCYNSNKKLFIYKINHKLSVSISFFGSSTISIKCVCTLSIPDEITRLSIVSKWYDDSSDNNYMFKDIIGISTKNSFFIGSITDDLKVIVKHEAMDTLFDLVAFEQDNLYYIYTDGLNLIVNLMDNQFQETEIGNYKLDKKPVFIGFLNPQTIVTCFEDSSCTLIWFMDSKELKTKINLTGTYINGKGYFRILTNEKVWNISLTTFQERIEMYQETNNFQGAIELCKKAIRNELNDMIGLPQNQAQLSIFLEKQISYILLKMLEDNHSDEQKLNETITYLINLSKELSLHDWMITNALSYCKSVGVLKQYFEIIMKEDPDATFFNYTTQFVDLLIETFQNESIVDFILKLPSKIASTGKILRFCAKTNNLNLSKNVYLNKLDDPFTCIKLFASIDNYQSLLEIFLSEFPKNNVEHNNEIVKWLFSYTNEDKFIHFIKLIKLNNMEFIKLTYEYIKLNNNQPITTSEFINNFIYILDLEQISATHPLYKLLEDFILESNPDILNISLKYLLKNTFSNNYAEPDRREDVLLLLLKNNSEIRNNEKIIQFCERFNFLTVNEYIFSGAQKFDNVIKSLLLYGGKDVFAYIRDKMIVSKEGIKNSILNNAVLLISKDVKQLLSIIITNYPEMQNDLLNILPDDSTKNYYLKSLFSYDPKYKITLDEDILKTYITYLCVYYPSEVRKFLTIYEGNISIHNYLETCKKYKIYDACAMISYRLGDMNDFLNYLQHYFITNLMFFIEDKINSIIDPVNLIIDFLTKYKISNYQKYTEIVIQSFALPLYSSKNKEKSSIISEALRRFCSFSIDHVPFEALLKTIIIQLAPIDIYIVRSAISGIINDYDYDIDTAISLSNLFKNDEISSQEKYILESISGTHYLDCKCGTCRRKLINGSSTIKMFPCGHVFHDNNECLPNQVCPICIPEARLDQDIQPLVTKLNTNQVLRKLRKFEVDLKPSKTKKQKFVPQKGNVSFCGYSLA